MPQTYEGSSLRPSENELENKDQDMPSNGAAGPRPMRSAPTKRNLPFKSSRERGSGYSNRPRQGGGRQENKATKFPTFEPTEEPQEPFPTSLDFHDVSLLPLTALRRRAALLGYLPVQIDDLQNAQLVFLIVHKLLSHGTAIQAEGVLEVMKDGGYGFLRRLENSYLPSSSDIYISSSHIRYYNLKTGDTLRGPVRIPTAKETSFALQKIDLVNFEDPSVAQTRVPFETLTPVYPTERIHLETKNGDVATRAMDLFDPIGKGQRGLIVAPPRSGKTVILQKIAASITENHPDVFLIVLLIGERPEEVTDMQRSVKGEVVASTFDEQASRHVQVTEMVLARAKRLAEHKRDVVILLDSITRLARAYNQTAPASGKILSGGVDSNALHRPKRFFGAARNFENGGSLTIMATALIETGSRMDEVIFEEFKGTGNMEIVLDRRLSDKRLFPAINIKKSGTRKEDLLLTSEELNKLWILRKVFSNQDDLELSEIFINKLKKTRTNAEFLQSMNTPKQL